MVMRIVGSPWKVTGAKVTSAKMTSNGARMTATAGATTDVRPCPISPVVELVFSRWTTPILWTLHEHGTQRFVELERTLGVTPKVLTQRLRQMERDGLVVRTYHPEIPPR